MSVSIQLRTRLPRRLRRAQLLDAAREAFVQHGYHAAGMDGIAELAGVSKPVVYQHFPGKLELYLAVLDECSAALVKSVRAALDSTHDNARRVHATFEAYFAFVAEESGAFRLIFESDLNNVPEVGLRMARTDEACAELIAGVIIEDTGLDRQRAMLLAAGLTGMAQTAARRWLMAPDLVSRSDAAAAMTALAWRGVSGFPMSNPPATAAVTAKKADADSAAVPARRSDVAEQAAQSSDGAEKSASTPTAAAVPRPRRTANAGQPRPKAQAAPKRHGRG